METEYALGLLGEAEMAGEAFLTLTLGVLGVTSLLTTMPVVGFLLLKAGGGEAIWRRETRLEV